MYQCTVRYYRFIYTCTYKILCTHIKRWKHSVKVRLLKYNDYFPSNLLKYYYFLNEILFMTV